MNLASQGTMANDALQLVCYRWNGSEHFRWFHVRSPSDGVTDRKFHRSLYAARNSQFEVRAPCFRLTIPFQ